MVMPARKPAWIPSVRAKRLAASLRQHREAARLSQAEAAARMEWSEAKVGHIESNRNGVDETDVGLLLDIYGVTSPQREAMLALAREARRRSWWNEYEDVFQSAYVAAEDDAAGIDDWSPQIIPGLLQTADYARALFIGGGLRNDAERRLEARLLRQAILSRSRPPRLRVVLDEAVLSKVIGSPEIMRDQLLHLTELRDCVTVQVLRGSVGAHPGLAGPLIVLHFAEEYPDVGYVEGFHGAVYLEGPQKVADCNVAMERIRELALSPQESVALIKEAAARL